MYYVTDMFRFTIIGNNVSIEIKEIRGLKSVREKLQKFGFTSCVSSIRNADAVAYYLDVDVKKNPGTPKVKKGDKVIVFLIPQLPNRQFFSREELNKMIKDVKIFEVSID